MKHWNSKKHKEGTGIYNELILSNMTYAVKVGKKVLPRIPVIPGFNDSLARCNTVCRNFKEHRNYHLPAPAISSVR